MKIRSVDKKLMMSFAPFWFFLLPVFVLAGPKTDTVYLYNGDKITGEIKRFEYGILTFKTDGMGTLSIEYDQIQTFYSPQEFTISTSTGLRFFGSIDTSNTPGFVNVMVRTFTIPEAISSIVEIYPVKNAFWSRLDGNIDLGYSYSKANFQSQLNSSFSIKYRVQKSYTEFSGSSIISDQSNTDPVRKQDYSFKFNRFFKNMWFASSYVGAQQNTELGNNYRLYGGLGIGNDIVHNNMQVLSGSLGCLISTEQSSADSTIQSVEGAMQWNYILFKFSKPDVNLGSYFNFYPSFTTWGRIRMEFEVELNIEIFNDFYFGLSFYDNFDSQPVDVDAEQNDWGVTTSIGYSW